MSLEPGSSLNHYEIVARLGEGGMGEVYRARDKRLGRDVAIKVLPKRLSDNPDSLARFEREARVLASLDHPTIGALFDLQEADGLRFLVLQLVEGPTLEERLRRGSLPVREALAAFALIAEALEVAHAKGIVHRDLKPANVKLSAGGVKVLDFGLAKAATPSLDEDSTVLLGSESTATVQGTVLGTAAYMSPEQARGEIVDERADIWAFGCCLFEALTGRRLFPGETLSQTLVEVLQREVDLSALPPPTPANVRVLVRRCLERDPSRRLQAVADARIELQETLNPPAKEPPAAMAAAPATGAIRWRQALGAGLLGLLVGAAALFVLVQRFTPTLVAVRQEPAAPQSVARFDVVLPADAPLRLDGGALTLSPDGETLVYTGTHLENSENGETVGNSETGENRKADRRLWRRELRSVAAEPLAGTEGGESPFFSPDGSQVAFFVQRELESVPLAGGAAKAHTAVGAGASGWWAEKGTIAASLSLPNYRGVSLVVEGAAEPRPVTTPQAAEGELAQLWPQLLPGGRAVLFTAWRGPALEQQSVVVASLDSGERHVLQDAAAYGRLLASGHLLFLRQDGLYVAPFSLDSLELLGAPRRMDDDPFLDPRSGLAQLTVSDSGTLAYLPETAPVRERSLLQVVEGQTPVALAAATANWRTPRVSPDGRWLAVTRVERRGCRLALFDRQSGEWSEVPFAGPALSPTWSPRGGPLVFAGLAHGRWNLYRFPVDEADAEPSLLDDAGELRLPTSFSPDGRLLTVMQMRADNNGWDIWVLPLGAESQAEPLIVSPAADIAPAFSPDGKAVAYVSDEEGGFEVYLKAYPGPSQRVRVSPDGGTDPRWDPRSARRLFYRSPRGEIIVVEVEAGPEPEVSAPRVLSGGIDLGLEEAAYDPLPSGDLLVVGPHPPLDEVRVVLGWFSELERLVPLRQAGP